MAGRAVRFLHLRTTTIGDTLTHYKFCTEIKICEYNIPQSSKKLPTFIPHLALSGAGGGGAPSSHTFVIPRKKLMGKVANFFTFPKYVNGRLGTTFCSQITFSMVGRELKWSKLPQFHKGGPCREQQEGKMTNQNRCLVTPDLVALRLL